MRLALHLPSFPDAPILAALRSLFAPSPPQNPRPPYTLPLRVQVALRAAARARRR
jgi:hypothetical protein